MGGVHSFEAEDMHKGCRLFHADAHRSLPAIRPPARLQGPTGCDGGDAQPAFSYISKAGGIAQTQVCTCSTWSAQQSPTCTTKACIAYVQ